MLTDRELSIPARVAAKYARGDEGLRQDLESEANLAFARSLVTFDPALGSATTYLGNVVTLRVRGHFAKRADRRRKLARSAESSPPPRQQPPVGAALEAEDFAAYVLPRMDPHCRQVLLLRAVEGLTFRQMAERLGVFHQTAANWYREALEQARRIGGAA